MQTFTTKVNILALAVLSIFWFNACDTEIDPVKETEALMQIDREFSVQSAEKGMKAAYLEFIDDAGVILRDGQLPVEGKAAVEAYLSELRGHYFSVTWEPIKAHVSEDADLGYTYGIWTMVTNDSIQITTKGTYVTIWKKNEEGKWKLVMDAGSEGI